MARRDTTKYCRFHNDYGHDTKECHHLKDEIELLIRQGHLRRYARPAGNQAAPEAPGGNERAERRQRSPPVAGTLLTICGGPHLAGEGNKALERYARTLRHEQDAELMAVNSCVSKKPRREEECIIFTKQDAAHVHFPHSDPLVVEMQIANMIVKRVLVDTGSSVNILYKSSLGACREISEQLASATTLRSAKRRKQGL